MTERHPVARTISDVPYLRPVPEADHVAQRRADESLIVDLDVRRPQVIIEALSEGVVFNSLEHSIGGADAAAVLRPKLSQAEIKEAICQAFGHAAKPYDFEFDFTSRDKLVCTEVVFRAYGANRAVVHPCAVRV